MGLYIFSKWLTFLFTIRGLNSINIFFYHSLIAFTEKQVLLNTFRNYLFDQNLNNYSIFNSTIVLTISWKKNGSKRPIWQIKTETIYKIVEFSYSNWIFVYISTLMLRIFRFNKLKISKRNCFFNFNTVWVKL